mmetsp:Transcript_56064/g.167807  ORF Transcript_56064/g.167807 Transcript_56064/m.167807 type:complete len:542 (-) Transcript_56064:360-1985(-)
MEDSGGDQQDTAALSPAPSQRADEAVADKGDVGARRNGEVMTAELSEKLGTCSTEEENKHPPTDAGIKEKASRSSDGIASSSTPSPQFDAAAEEEPETLKDGEKEKPRCGALDACVKKSPADVPEMTAGASEKGGDAVADEEVETSEDSKKDTAKPGTLPTEFHRTADAGVGKSPTDVPEMAAAASEKGGDEVADEEVETSKDAKKDIPTPGATPEEVRRTVDVCEKMWLGIAGRPLIRTQEQQLELQEALKVAAAAKQQQQKTAYALKKASATAEQQKEMAVGLQQAAANALQQQQQQALVLQAAAATMQHQHQQTVVSLQVAAATAKQQQLDPTATALQIAVAAAQQQQKQAETALQVAAVTSQQQKQTAELQMAAATAQQQQTAAALKLAAATAQQQEQAASALQIFSANALQQQQTVAALQGAVTTAQQQQQQMAAQTQALVQMQMQMHVQIQTVMQMQARQMQVPAVPVPMPQPVFVSTVTPPKVDAAVVEAEAAKLPPGIMANTVAGEAARRVKRARMEKVACAQVCAYLRWHNG